ncbi:hypothetical protein LSAT2_004309, partial [Lamellibrachia satsuma]
MDAARDKSSTHTSTFWAPQPSASALRTDETANKQKYMGGATSHHNVDNKDTPISIGQLKIEIVQGDLTKEQTDAIVNSSNGSLDLTQGAISQAIAKAGGRSLVEECKKHGTIPSGGIAVTEAGKLPCDRIIHINAERNTRWPIIINNVLVEAEQLRIKSVSFPALGTGIHGLKPCDAANNMLEAIISFTQTNIKYLKLVRIVIFEQKMKESFKESLEKVASPPVFSSSHRTNTVPLLSAPLYSSPPVECSLYSSPPVECPLYSSPPVECSLYSSPPVECSLYSTATEVHSKPAVELADIKVKVSSVEDTSPAENEWDGKTIKVCGLQRATSDRVIRSFFQNKNQSSGGYIKMFDIDRNNGVAYVTFVTAGVAQAVLEKPDLNLEGGVLDVSRVWDKARRQEESDRQDKSRRPVESDRQDRSRRLEESGRPDRSRRPEESDRQNKSRRLVESDRQGKSRRPEESDRHDKSRRWEESDRQVKSRRREEFDRPDRSHRWEESLEPERSSQEEWDGRTIEVYGFNRSATGDAIVLSFESKFSSGDVTVQSVQRSPGKTVTYLTFESAEVTKKALSVKAFSLDGTTVTVQPARGVKPESLVSVPIISHPSQDSKSVEKVPFKQNHSDKGASLTGHPKQPRPTRQEKRPVEQDVSETRLQNWDQQTIEVRNVRPNTSKEVLIRCFLDKNLCQHGGEVEEVDTSNQSRGIVYVKFREPGVASSVLNQKSMRVEGVVVDVAPCLSKTPVGASAQLTTADARSTHAVDARSTHAVDARSTHAVDARSTHAVDARSTHAVDARSTHAVDAHHDKSSTHTSTVLAPQPSASAQITDETANKQ